MSSRGVATPVMAWLKSLIPSAEATARNTGNDRWLRQLRVLLGRRRDRPKSLNTRKLMVAYLLRNLAVTDFEAETMTDNLWSSYLTWMKNNNSRRKDGPSHLTPPDDACCGT